MNKLLTLSAGMAFAISMHAQQAQYNENGSYYKQCISHWESRPLSELVAEYNAKHANDKPAGKITPRPAPDEDAHENRRPKNNSVGQNVSTVDGARQTENGTIINDMPSSFTPVNIDGQQGLQGYYPLDPNGMIGSNYYVQTVNVNYAIYNKNGTIKMAATDLVNLFTGSNDFGDPVVMYDKPADRWVITEFDGPSTNNIKDLLFAVSATNDPTGTYHLYTFDPDNGRRQVDDYPKYVVWSDGYYCTCNCAPNDYVIAFQRDSMLKGATAGYIATPWNYGPYNLTTNCGGGFFCPQLLDCDGTLPPYGSPEYLFYYWDDNWGCGGVDSICIEKVSMNWTTKNGTITANYQHLPTSSFNSVFTGGTRADIAQPGNVSTNYLDASDGFFFYRLPYLRWGSYNSVVMAHVVNVGTTSMIGGIRWYELHQDTATNLWSIKQQSTYAPNDGVSRWNPAIAMDQNGSIGLEYTVSSPTSVYPGLRYTGRRSCDVLNTMTVAEVDVVNGNAIANTPSGNGNRWGDYSHLSVDPIDGITFWATNMYTNSSWANSTNIGTRIASFQITKCPSDVEDVNPAAASLVAYQNGNSLIVKGTNFPENEKLSVQLFDINGRMLQTKEMVSTSQTMETSFNVSSLAKAIYIVRIGNDHIQRVIKTPIN